MSASSGMASGFRASSGSGANSGRGTDSGRGRGSGSGTNSGSGTEYLGVGGATEQRSRDYSVDDEHRLVATSTSESAQCHNPGDHCAGGRFVERQCLRSNGEHVSSLAPPGRVMRRPVRLTPVTPNSTCFGTRFDSKALGFIGLRPFGFGKWRKWA